MKGEQHTAWASAVQLVLPQPGQDEIDEGDQETACNKRYDAKVHSRDPYVCLKFQIARSMTLNPPVLARN